MKKIYILLILIAFQQSLFGQSEKKENLKFNSLLITGSKIYNDEPDPDKGESIAIIINEVDTLINYLKKAEGEANIDLVVYNIYKKIEEAKKVIEENALNSNSSLYFEARLNSLEFLAKNVILTINNKAKISIIGDAAILNGNTESQNVNGIGSLGLNFLSKKRSFEVTALINLVGTRDTSILKRDSLGNFNNSTFGRSVLNPFSGANSLSSGIITSKWYLLNAWSDFRNVGLMSSIGFASQNWKDTNGVTEQANILSFSTGLFWNILSRYVNINDDFQLIPFLNFTGRIIYGDVRKNNDFRKRALLTNQVDFWGMEIGFQIKFSQFSAYVMLPALFGGSSAKGITEGQFVAGISLNTAFRVVEF